MRGNTNNWWMLRNPAQGSYTASVTGGALNCSIGLRAATLRGAGETTASQNVNCVPPDAVNGDLILAHGGASNQPKDVGTEAPAGSLYDWNNASYGQEIAYMENATYNYVNFTCSGSNVLNSECAFYETPEIKAAVAIAPNMML